MAAPRNLPESLTPDPAYQKRLARLLATLDGTQVDALLGRVADRWATGDQPLPAREELFTKLMLEGLLYGPTAALADLDHLLNESFGRGLPAGGAA